MKLRSTRSLIGCATVLALAGNAQAATITSVGTELGQGASYIVENWSNAGTLLIPIPKTYDIDGNNKYGTAGYYQIRPTTGDQFYEGAAEGNDLGISLPTFPTLYSAPAFISGLVGAAGGYPNFAGYSVYRTPDGAGLVQQGALSVSTAIAGTNPAGAGNWGNVISFTLNQTKSFRIGLAVDSVASATYAPNFVSIYNASTGSVFSSALTRNGVPDMVFFDISGINGDSFAVALWQNSPDTGPVALSLVTFDVVPEPAAALLGSLGLLGLLRRRRS